jgi:hypothetical protein
MQKAAIRQRGGGAYPVAADRYQFWDRLGQSVKATFLRGMDRASSAFLPTSEVDEKQRPLAGNRQRLWDAHAMTDEEQAINRIRKLLALCESNNKSEATLAFAVPVAYSWTFIEVWKGREAKREEHWDQLMLLALAGGAMLIAVAPALSMRRISCASPPAMILLVWLLSRKRRSWQIAARGLAAISAALALAQVVAAQLHHADQLDLPAGHVAIADARNAEVYRWMARRTHLRANGISGCRRIPYRLP